MNFTCFLSPLDFLGIAPLNDELTLSLSDIKRPEPKSRPHKNEVLLQSRLSTRHNETAQHRRTDYKSFVEADDARIVSKWPSLTPSQLHMIALEPSVLDFGEVVTKTPCHRNITIVNNHDEEILVQLNHTKGDELQFLSVIASSFIVPGTNWGLTR